MGLAVATSFGCLVATYLFFRFLLRLTQDPKEPPTIETELPFLAPVLGMIRKKSQYYVLLRDKYRLPIYTLRLPFLRMYIVNDIDLIPIVQKQWRTISFAVFSANAGKQVGMSKSAIKIMKEDLTHEKGFSVSWPKYIAPSVAPGKDLDTINQQAIEGFATEMERLRAEGTIRVGLWQWSRHTMVVSTSNAIWGSQNPFQRKEVAEAWEIFESGFLTLNIFPFASFFFPKISRARDLLVGAMVDYVRKGGHETASALLRALYDHHRQFNLGLDDIARSGLGIAFAVLSNSAPCALWLLYHIFSDDRVLADIRDEVSVLVRENGTDKFVDLASIRTSCPILLSTFQETLRYRSLNPGARILLEDALLDTGTLLKKGSMLMMPALVHHTNATAWGTDARMFNHLRFTDLTSGRKRPNRVAFRAFGGGHVLCPGRHLASTEIMALAALLVLQFDIMPIDGGKWVEPTWKNSPMQAAFPIPDDDIHVELRPRDPGVKWCVTFSGSDDVVPIVSEDIAVTLE
ncbi:cytochrome P450 [Xylaria acuta]|nr:cytochrome P450 [Xylaria acuta]